MAEYGGGMYSLSAGLSELSRIMEARSLEAKWLTTEPTDEDADRLLRMGYTEQNSQLLRNRQQEMVSSYYKALYDAHNKGQSDVKQEPLIITEGVEVIKESELLQEITVADGYMRVKHTYFFRPKWWQFWKAPRVDKKAWYTTISYGIVSFDGWCTEDGNGVDTSTRLWLHKISEAYFGRKRAEKAAAKLREVDAKMESPEIAELDPSSPTYNPLKKLRKEKVSE